MGLMGHFYRLWSEGAFIGGQVALYYHLVATSRNVR